ncbi:hypothetical protein Pfo_024623 [Paulownia fortunei]|nr:hypothetical protein Pfo_024623 [Paulownia fortunei]
MVSNTSEEVETPTGKLNQIAGEGFDKEKQYSSDEGTPTPKKLISTLQKEEDEESEGEEISNSESEVGGGKPEDSDPESNNSDTKIEERSGATKEHLELSARPEEEKSGPHEHSQKKNAAVIFSQHDEIIMLKGLKKFWKKHGINDEWVQFHQYIKSQLEVDFSKRQVYEKIRRLKDKFTKTCSRNDNKSPLEFLDGHEALLFKLSKSLWGNNVDSGIPITKKGKRAKTEVDMDIHTTKRKRAKTKDNLDVEMQQQVELVSKKKPKRSINADEVHLNSADYPLLSTCFKQLSVPEIVKQNWTLIGCCETARKLERKWGKLCKKELSLTVKKMDFMFGVFGVILEKMKGN